MKIPGHKQHDIVISAFSSLLYVGVEISSFLILSVDRTIALIKGASSFANIVFPTPGKLQNSIINNQENVLEVINVSGKLTQESDHNLKGD